MSASAVEVVRAAFASWDDADEPDIDALFDAHFHEEVEYREDPMWPGAGVYRGRAAVTDCFRAYMELIPPAWSRVEEVVDAGEDVVLVLRVAVVGAGSETPVEQLWGYVCRVADGKVSFFQAYVDPREAFAAAGLRTADPAS